MATQFVEYADVERPGVKLVSVKQVQLFPNDTSFGVLLYVVIHATSPNLIETPPQIQMSITLGSTDPREGIKYIKVMPSRIDYPLVTKITRPDGTEVVINSSVDRNSVYPLKDIEGHIYFQVAKIKTQRIFASNLNLIG